MTTVTKKKTISGSELKVRLNGLGLSPSWFAERNEVTMRTVVRWFDGGPVAPEVAAQLEKLSDLTLKEMLKMLAEIDDGDDPVVLRTYRTDEEFPNKKGWPASWHRALTCRVLEHLRTQGRTVVIEYR